MVEMSACPSSLPVASEVEAQLNTKEFSDCAHPTNRRVEDMAKGLGQTDAVGPDIYVGLLLPFLAAFRAPRQQACCRYVRGEPRP